MGSALIGAGATIFAACIAAWIVMHQIDRQAKLSRQQAALSERLKLNLDVYRQILAIGLEYEDAHGALAVKLHTLISSFIKPWKEPDQWNGYQPSPTISGKELLALHGTTHITAVKFITLIENWQVIDKRLDLYQVAIIAALHEARAAWEAFFRLAANVIGFEPVSGGSGQWSPPEDYSWTTLEAVSNDVIDKWGTVECYIHDFKVEMQNLLMQNLFDDRVTVRQPLDPKKFALSFDKYQAQKSYFDNDSVWAKHAAKVKADTIARLEGNGA